MSCTDIFCLPAGSDEYITQKARRLQEILNAVAAQDVKIERSKALHDKQVEQEENLKIFGQGLLPASLSVEDIIHYSKEFADLLQTQRKKLCVELQRQIDIVNGYAERIEALSWSRLEELPIAIQKEHEGCALDIAELSWHLDRKRTHLQKTREKLEVSEKIKTQLEDDIALLLEQIPLVEEKLKFEADKVSAIEEKKKELAAKTEIAEAMLSETLMKHKQATEAAYEERVHMQKEIDDAKVALDKAKNRLLKSQNENAHLLRSIAKSKKKISSNATEMEVLKNDRQRQNTIKEAYQKMVDEAEHSFESQLRKEDEFAELLEVEAEKRAALTQRQNNKRAELELKRNKLAGRLADINRSIAQLIKIVEDEKRKLTQCDIEHKENDLALDRLRTQLDAAEEELKIVTKEYNSVCLKHTVARDRYNAEERRIRDIEGRLQSVVSDLERQLKQEFETRTGLLERMRQDAGELTKGKDEYEKQRRQLVKFLAEAQARQEKLIESVKLHKIKDMQQKQSSEAAENDYVIVTQTIEREIKSLQQDYEYIFPIHSLALSDVHQLRDKLNFIKSETVRCKLELEELEKSLTMIMKNRRRTDKAVKELEQEASQLKLTCKLGQFDENACRNDAKALSNRMEQNAATHEAYMQDREKVLDLIEQQFLEALSENKLLASSFRKTQQDYIPINDAFMDVKQENLWAESLTVTLRQIQKLQLSLCHAVQLHLKAKTDFEEAELSRLQKECKRNKTEVTFLRDELQSNNSEMATFLEERKFVFSV